MKKAIATFFLVVVLVSCLAGCSSWERSMKDINSDFGGGLERTINVYSMTGEPIATHTGKIDVEDRDSSILFELNGKRYVYYNAIIEVIEN